MRFFVLALFLFSGIVSHAQNLTGIWRGKRTQIAGGCFPEYSLEMQISFSNNSIMGRSYNFYDTERYTKINFTGKYNPQTHRMVIIESAVLQYNVPSHCVPCIKTYDLVWVQNGKEEALSGEWKGHEMGNSNICPPGTIYLTRQTEPMFPVDVEQNDTLSKIQRNMTVKNRDKEVVRNIVVDTSQIRIDVYDNAEIDDDTVSIFLNNTLLAHKKRLTDRPLTLSINAFPNTDYELMMYAENLGRIPPNTSLMIITAGDKRYEMRITASEQKNAVVKFRYVK
jgi:hypothetical protein